MGNGPLHWTGNFDEVQDFEGQIRTLAGGTGLHEPTRCSTRARARSRSAIRRPGSVRRPRRARRLRRLARDRAREPAARRRRASRPQARAGPRSRSPTTRADRATAARRSPTARSTRATTSARSTRAAAQRLGAPLDGFDTPTLRRCLGDGALSARRLRRRRSTAAIAAHAGDPTTPTERAAIAAFLTELNPATRSRCPSPRRGSRSARAAAARAARAPPAPDRRAASAIATARGIGENPRGPRPAACRTRARSRRRALHSQIRLVLVTVWPTSRAMLYSAAALPSDVVLLLCIQCHGGITFMW